MVAMAKAAHAVTEDASTEHVVVLLFQPSRGLLLAPPEQLRELAGGQLAAITMATASLVDQLSVSAAAGARLSDIGKRLSLPRESLLSLLEAVAAQTPAGSATPEGSLAESEEAVLREAGSLQQEMPDLERRASFRTQLLFEQLLEGALTVKQAAGRLGVSEGRIRQRLSARTLVGVERSGSWRLPQFQFTTEADLPGLPEVLPAFPEDVHPASILMFLDAPSSELELDGEPLSPKAWLATGGSARRVAELVRDAYDLP